MSIGKVISLDDTIEKMKMDYLYDGNEKYLKFIKKLYSIDYNKWSTYFWELYIVKLFEEELREGLFHVKNIRQIAKDIAHDIKEERERIIILSYIEGAVFGHRNMKLSKELIKICDKVINEKKSNKIHISEVMRSKHIRTYNEVILREMQETDYIEEIKEVLLDYCENKIYDKLKKYSLKRDIALFESEIYRIFEKDCLEKYKDGVWDGVVARVVKDVNRKYKIIL
ncbi:hypothetical protein [Alkalithermobacter paradoxus]|uniref:Uncharacterized protein n=1 Tax=Alkalithermobacter paradoxus TaxID=29349 RepID=A0A1V4I8Z5_9FIRM|nr:hypothetical protein CLOTH_07440 [[Clostridium] thermoalcaliphilum]